MQSIYAMHQNNSDQLEKEEKFLLYSIDNALDLYLVMISTLIEIKDRESTIIEVSRKKHLSTPEERNPNTRFIDNQVLQILDESKSIKNEIFSRKLNNWSLNEQYIQLFLDEIKSSDLYLNYMQDKFTSFEKDRDFIVNIFSDLIVPNEKLYEYIEDNKLTWIDDLPMVNTLIVKQLSALKKETEFNFRIPKLFKDVDDKEFVTHLFRKTVLNENEFSNEFRDKTPNWDIDRIAEIDTIILKMAICEFFKFPSIPTKVTINEYVEIAKEYSTPKSSIFINGILDTIVKDTQTQSKIQKIGRGLL